MYNKRDMIDITDCDANR